SANHLTPPQAGWMRRLITFAPHSARKSSWQARTGVTRGRGRGRKGATKRVGVNSENLLYPVMGEKGVWCRLGLVLDCKSAPRKSSSSGVKVSGRLADRHLGEGDGREWTRGRRWM